MMHNAVFAVKRALNCLLVLLSSGAFLCAGYAAADVEAAKLTEGLVAHWSFNGNISDVSGSGFDGVWQGKHENAPGDKFVDGAPGSRGRAIKFDGKQDFITHREIVFKSEENHTLSIWQFLPEDLPSGFHAILGSDIYGTGGYLAFLGKGLRIYQYVHAGDVHILNLRAVIGEHIPLGEWFHMAIVTSPANPEKREVNYKIYINGSLKHDINTEWSSAVDLFRYNHLGGNGGNRFFTGLMDDVRVYNRALAPGEISGLYTLWE